MLVKRLAIACLGESRGTEQSAQASLCFVFDRVLPNGGVLEGLAALQPRCCGSETEERKRLGGWLEFVQCAILHVGRGIKE